MLPFAVVHGLRQVFLGLTTVATLGYLTLALAGDLRERPSLLLAGHALLLGAMLGALWIVRRERGLWRWAVAASLLFRLVAVPGEPALSDDLYRYLWDGRVQLHGLHPYRFAPADPLVAEQSEALATLQRGEQAAAVNHSELRTIYPPVAQWFFLAVAALGAGPVGLKLALGLVDFGVVLALGALLGRMRLPRASGSCSTPGTPWRCWKGRGAAIWSPWACSASSARSCGRGRAVRDGPRSPSPPPCT